MTAGITKKINISSVIKQIVENYQPEKILLFGSQASGNADEYSDVDLIIIKRTNKSFLQRLVEPVLLAIDADVFVYTPEEFERMKEAGNLFIESALKNSKVLYEKHEAKL